MALGNGHWSDFIGDYMALTEGTLSPEIFRLWAGIGAIAGALERRVWMRNKAGTAYPNMFTLLVASPGVGKLVINTTKQLWRATHEPGSRVPAFKVNPDNMTKASLIDRLAKARQQRIIPKGPPLEYHSMLIAAEEFGVLLPAYDLEYIGSLNSIWNNPDLHEEERRHGPAREVSIMNPTLNILGGTQPGWLGSVFPEEAWSMGLASRLIMVYSTETPDPDIFEPVDDEPKLKLFQHLVQRLSALSQLYGEFKWEPEALAQFREWYTSGHLQSTPEHSKLEHYNRRRRFHAIKLVMVSAAARSGHLFIEPIDVQRGVNWLIGAERTMPDIFREMIGKTDAAVIDELHFFLTTTYARNGNKPVHESTLWNFLKQRVPSEKIERVLAIAERSNVVTRIAGMQSYKPRPRHEHGLE